MIYTTIWSFSGNSNCSFYRNFIRGRFQRAGWLFALWFFLACGAIAQVPAPAEEQQRPVVLLGGTVHIGDGTVIENGVVTFENGIITAVQETGAFRDTSGYRVIHTGGKHIYPGLILPNTNLGLQEISAVRATRDYRETGELNPSVRAIIAYNAESQLIPTLRFNGILLAQITPSGGLLSGLSSVVQLDAWNWEDAVVKEDGGMHLRWPDMYKQSGSWNEPLKMNAAYEKEVEKLGKLFSEAAAYGKTADPVIVNLKLAAMKGLFDGSTTLYLHVRYSKEIIEAVNFVKNHGVKKVVLVGAEDAFRVRDFIKENNIPVLLADLHRLPGRRDAAVDDPYKLAGLLQNEGILVGLCYEGAMNARNLPFFAGTAAAYGLSREEALKAVTSNTAKILGIDDKVGTLAKGKEAYIVVSSGDLLDMRTNHVEYAFIQGREVVLEHHQQKLYKKYTDKYAREK